MVRLQIPRLSPGCAAPPGPSVRGTGHLCPPAPRVHVTTVTQGLPHAVQAPSKAKQPALPPVQGHGSILQARRSGFSVPWLLPPRRLPPLPQRSQPVRLGGVWVWVAGVWAGDLGSHPPPEGGLRALRSQALHLAQLGNAAAGSLLPGPAGAGEGPGSGRLWRPPGGGGCGTVPGSVGRWSRGRSS